MDQKYNAFNNRKQKTKCRLYTPIQTTSYLRQSWNIPKRKNLKKRRTCLSCTPSNISH